MLAVQSTLRPTINLMAKGIDIHDPDNRRGCLFVMHLAGQT